MELRRTLAWVLLVLYLINVALCVVANVIDSRLFIVFTKILIIPLLVIYLLFVRTNLMSKIVVFTVGLGFSWAGDVALLVDHDNAFYVGLGFFFVTHVLYTISFLRHAGKHHVPIYIIAGIVYAIAAALLIYFISKVEVAVVVVVVAFYVVAVAVMAVVATNLNILGAFGGLLFAISDSLIAAEKFATWSWIPDDNIMSALIIGFYGVSQLLLACAVVRSVEKKQPTSLNDEYGYNVPIIMSRFDNE